ncbi:type II toxin-antitoxin system VapC family toxin [Acidovorax sp. HDW3]|uniref:type II toxin-antitoxin system VapC family toxin n=1 Tax=Acidovorax sp. HDW3 TaxID=2714923 RepID=UPI00140D1A94|nr:type II toxin-antitoxin system VapC family toxin [Acidovorax sp. HDW3]QIL42845.1 type II toxin-antitoxin system VapC family toxin [Acidovorax sp. HDW3]
MSKGFLLNTNVLSELMRPQPATQVLGWFALQTSTQLYTSSITHAEILAGIALLPPGKRRNALAEAASQIFEEDFLGRCFDFSGSAIAHYAQVRAQRQLAGKPIDTADAQIAAIALTTNLTLVTRNTKDFEGIDNLEIINPWQPH